MLHVALDMVSSLAPEDLWIHPSLVVRAQRSAKIVQNLFGTIPHIAVIAGSGFTHAFAPFNVESEVDMKDVFDIAVPRVSGHGTTIQVLDVEGVTVLLFGGRHHLYEGVSAEDVCLATMTCVFLKATNILYTNAAGALSPNLPVGDVVLCSDVMSGVAIVPPYRSVGRRFEVINEEWRRSIMANCLDRGIRVNDGTYVQVKGPSYETRAEIRMYRKIGADVIGMSTVLEARLAALLGLRVAAITLISNTLTDVQASVLTHTDVVSAGHQYAERLQAIIKTAILCA